VDYARSRYGLKVYHGSLEEVQLEEAPYDVVTMWDVIEHLPDPKDTLRRLRAVLADAGMLCVSTYDVDSLYARLSGSRYPWFMPMHLVHYSRRTITMLLERCGFEVVRIKRHVRMVRLDYFFEKGCAAAPALRFVLSPVLSLIKDRRLGRMVIPLHFFGIMNVYAKKA